ncbi:ribosome-associated translation inhibitor RaiA [Kitasatospora paracochleata]|uniref:Ribosome hibernation promoting factor n=1 Tax=Kitasatospora paracochleata TaxID=58354 RepID=A0ABT1IY37_9ACTN|nr:ribosome-associated translation inhibitor RaiA [Kitasatospora paracochleata]MCP2310059.1 ribosomal subunit interface protein [Kitasatospora paracochleata]
MDIVVKGRKTEVPKRFREHVAEKLEKVQKFDTKAISLDVEVSKEHNPRQADRSDRVEITLRSRGPVIRAEAAATDPWAALDLASAKLEAQLRKSADRRRVHKGGGNGRTPVSVAEATAALASLPATAPSEGGYNGSARKTMQGSVEVEGDGPLVVREKTHSAAPMSLDQALYAMELVGHDFYLFQEKDSGLPSVVYRRHGYHYGVIHLKEDLTATGDTAGAGGAINGPDED